MYGVEVLIEEHENIRRMAKVMRAASLNVLNGNEVSVRDFDEMVEFIRNYADNHHHKKEEDVLFVYMKNELGKIADNLITHGMLVEHDLGRLHMQELNEALREYERKQSQEAKLDIIVNATAYTYLINRHIEKENAVVFTFGESKLSEDSIKAVNELTREMEDRSTKEGIQKHYLNILASLEKKYCN